MRQLLRATHTVNVVSIHIVRLQAAKALVKTLPINLRSICTRYLALRILRNQIHFVTHLRALQNLAQNLLAVRVFVRLRRVNISHACKQCRLNKTWTQRPTRTHSKLADLLARPPKRRQGDGIVALARLILPKRTGLLACYQAGTCSGNCGRFQKIATMASAGT